MSEKTAIRSIVRGRVQGVGFRVFVKRVAQGLALAGEVRNRSDGGVEVVAEGNETSLRALESELRAGPGAARVEDVETESLEPVGRTGFRVVY